ncbi:hypothetical protein GQ607_006347 [Colletotrichum asianum]|uniref:Uncharacterized protein n=1 Tax=Colletotrichum asianum TaxID=702518 RepID=A0A8H3WKZ0_9PEZI|nr:hypothetical protein GQ607_006347 [Colletotrichum asianum]
MIYKVCFSAFTMVLLFLRGERRRLGGGGLEAPSVHVSYGVGHCCCPGCI